MPGVTIPGRISIWWYQCGTAAIRSSPARGGGDSGADDSEAIGLSRAGARYR
jgi:hypothetical protein